MTGYRAEKHKIIQKGEKVFQKCRSLPWRAGAPPLPQTWHGSILLASEWLLPISSKTVSHIYYSPRYSASDLHTFTSFILGLRFILLLAQGPHKAIHTTTAEATTEMSHNGWGCCCPSLSPWATDCLLWRAPGMGDHYILITKKALHLSYSSFSSLIS